MCQDKCYYKMEELCFALWKKRDSEEVTRYALCVMRYALCVMRDALCVMRWWIERRVVSWQLAEGGKGRRGEGEKGSGELAVGS